MTRLLLCALLGVSSAVAAADKLESKTTYAKAYGETKNAVAVDPAKDLPRYPAVAAQDAIATWQVKAGFQLELAANEPQVRSPIALCFDERGRMFVCEMIDYSELRDATPHLGRVSVLEDADGDGHFEKSAVFADDLAWPTGVIWANGGLYVIATPDIWFFKDADGDGKAEVREKVFTGFGTGLKLLNVQGLANSPQWGLDNRIHILAGGGNRGVVTCLKRPELKGAELGGKDFWFDPRTHDFGLEGGGAQYGMSFDNEGRKFGCSNSDHLQYWTYDDRYANRSPWFSMPPARQSIAVDGGAAEVFRISPDEPWRIIRTRWRIAGVVKGAVEGGGRVSGYFTGATGTTIYRGDAYGAEFVGNSFTGDAGGQLVHRKVIKPSADGVSLIGERPADERGFEFAASKDTWVRVVNFANAPDGCLYVIDMHREVIEHPWSIPDEIKQHIDLNSGSDMGRIYRIVPERGIERKGQRPRLDMAPTGDLVKMLSHTNGWHRDTAQRLLYERQDKAALRALDQMIATRSHGVRPGADGRVPAVQDKVLLGKLHALGVLQGMGALTLDHVLMAVRDPYQPVKIRGIKLAEQFIREGGIMDQALCDALVQVGFETTTPSVLLQLACTLGQVKKLEGLRTVPSTLDAVDMSFLEMIAKTQAHPLIVAACFSGVHDSTGLFPALMQTYRQDAKLLPAVRALLEVIGHKNDATQVKETLQALLKADHAKAQLPALIQSFATGLKRASNSLESVDTDGALRAIFAQAATTLRDEKAVVAARLEALPLCALATSAEAEQGMLACLSAGTDAALQTAVLKVLSQRSAPSLTKAMIDAWPHYAAAAKTAALEALLARDDRALALLNAMSTAQGPKPSDLTAAQVQALVKHKNEKIATQALTALASVIPPSRESVVVTFKPALSLTGSAEDGAPHYQSRCLACHVADGQGMPVGPDLVTVKTKGREGILSAILEPHKEVASQFIAYVVNTKDGQTVSGIVTKDDASSMTLKMMGGAEVTLQRSNIQGSSSSGQSLMPEGLETGLTPQDMANLLAYIEALK